MLEWLVDCVSKAYYHTDILFRPEREEKLVHVDTVTWLRARLCTSQKFAYVEVKPWKG